MTKKNPDIIGKKIAYLYETLLFIKNKEVKQLGIVPTHYNFFLTLLEYPGCNQNFLAKKRKVNKAVVTRVITKYVKTGLIQKKQHAENKSAYSLYLTTEGEKIAKKIQIIITDINEAIIQHYSEEELQSFIRQLDKLATVLEEIKCEN